MNIHQITRESERKPLDILVEGRLRSRPFCVDLLDVSEGGCKLKGRFGFAKVGDTITLKVDGIRAPLGTVVWVDDHYVGVAFDGRMHEAVIDHLWRKRLQQHAETAQRKAG